VKANGAPLGAELRRLLDERGMRPRELARRTGMHVATLHHWLNGTVRRPYNWEGLLVIANELQLSKRDTNRLLRAAGLVSIDTLLDTNHSSHVRALLARWLPPGAAGRDTANC
jgi:transcriptional regulator with XRE-family HTH domain